MAEDLVKGDEQITEQTIEQAVGQKLPRYDKKGDGHYDIISAFIKSMRGSDEDAALYYLARMIQAGEDPKIYRSSHGHFCQRRYWTGWQWRPRFSPQRLYGH